MFWKKLICIGDSHGFLPLHLGAVYANSKSGWFEQNTFTQWFTECLLPNLKRLHGKKVA